MICYKVNEYCGGNISQIENYKQAINDTTQTWDCHHRLETELDLTPQQLIDMNKYYNRPPSELIFLTHSEHQKLHFKKYIGTHRSDITKQRISEACKGKPSPMKGKKHSEESIERMRQSHLGQQTWLGKKHSEESKEKIRQAKLGKPAPCKGRHRVYREDGSFYMSF